MVYISRGEQYDYPYRFMRGPKYESRTVSVVMRSAFGIEMMTSPDRMALVVLRPRPVPKKKRKENIIFLIQYANFYNVGPEADPGLLKVGAMN